MKRTILASISIATLAIAAPAFAQSTSTVTQTGGTPGNEATVTQGGGASNTSTVNQDTGAGGPFDPQTATVYQWGGNNASNVQQTSAGSTDAVVTQIGAYNNSTIDQRRVGSTANVGQYGTAGRSYVLQIGEGSNVGTTGAAGVLQLAGSYNEQSDIIQGGGNNSAGVTQGGTSDYSLIKQNSDPQVSDNPNTANTATVAQYGGSNFSQILQGETNNDSSNNTAMVGQYGSYNISYVTQDDDGHTATVNQYGNSDTSYVTQSGAANTATVSQY